MARLDLILFVLFGTFVLLGLLSFVFCLRGAMRAARARDQELRMFFWAAGAMIGLIVAGVSSVYILLPILMNL